jgi:hypothetical protein
MLSIDYARAYLLVDCIASVQNADLYCLLHAFVIQVIFMVGNKSDLDAQRDVTYEEAKQFAEENGNYSFFSDVYLMPSA